MEIILIIGLPGSGKSTLIKNDYANETKFKVFDDFKSCAVLDCDNFAYSRYYPHLVKEIKEGSKNIVISDISFCEDKKFEEAYKILDWWITEFSFDYKIKLVIFKNEPAKCIKNIDRSNGRNKQKRIEMVKKFSPNFDPYRMKKTNDDCIIDVYDEETR
jgi:tRNA uridine 5-carbamoylmethylation protein Kti12